MCDVFVDGCKLDVTQLFAEDGGETTNASTLLMTDNQHAIYIETRSLLLMANICCLYYIMMSISNTNEFLLYSHGMVGYLPPPALQKQNICSNRDWKTEAETCETGKTRLWRRK